MGNSLVVLWLGFWAFTAEGPDSIPSQGTKIPQAALCGQKKKKKGERMSQSFGERNQDGRIGEDWAHLLPQNLITQSCQTLCDPTDCSLPGSSVHGILQAKYWSGLPFPSPCDLPCPGLKPGSPALQRDSLPTEPDLPHKHIKNTSTCGSALADNKLKTDTKDLQSSLWRTIHMGSDRTGGEVIGSGLTTPAGDTVEGNIKGLRMLQGSEPYIGQPSLRVWHQKDESP